MHSFDIIVRLGEDDYINLSFVKRVEVSRYPTQTDPEGTYIFHFKDGTETSLSMTSSDYYKVREYLNAIAPDILNDYVRKTMLAMQERAKQQILKDSGYPVKETDFPKEVKTDIPD